MPLVQSRTSVLGMYFDKILDLKKRLESLQKSLNKAERDRDHYKELYKKEQEKSDELQERIPSLASSPSSMPCAKRLREDDIESGSQERRSGKGAQRNGQQQKLARKRHDRGAR